MATKQTGEAPSRRRQQSPFPVTTLPAISVRISDWRARLRPVPRRPTSPCKCVVHLHRQTPTSSTLPTLPKGSTTSSRGRGIADADGAEGALGHRLSELVNDYYLNLLDWSADNRLAVALGADVYLWNAGKIGLLRSANHQMY